MTTASVATAHDDVSFPAANEALRKLESIGLVSQRPGHSRPRLYQCDRVMQIIDE